MTITLQEHRAKLTGISPSPAEIERLIGTVTHHLRGARYVRVPLGLKARFVDLILETQDRKPFFWIDGDLPYCWNAPKDFHKPHIAYEWGHLIPRSSDYEAAYNVENLCLMSARCNNHIQSSLPVNELSHYFKGSLVGKRIDYVLKKRRKLFASKEWKAIRLEFEGYKYKK